MQVNICAGASYLVYTNYFENYYDVMDLKTAHAVDVSTTNGSYFSICVWRISVSYVIYSS